MKRGSMAVLSESLVTFFPSCRNVLCFPAFEWRLEDGVRIVIVHNIYVLRASQWLVGEATCLVWVCHPFLWCWYYGRIALMRFGRNLKRMSVNIRWRWDDGFGGLEVLPFLVQVTFFCSYGSAQCRAEIEILNSRPCDEVIFAYTSDEGRDNWRKYSFM